MLNGLLVATSGPTRIRCLQARLLFSLSLFVRVLVQIMTFFSCSLPHLFTRAMLRTPLTLVRAQTSSEIRAPSSCGSIDPLQKTGADAVFFVVRFSESEHKSKAGDYTFHFAALPAKFRVGRVEYIAGFLVGTRPASKQDTPTADRLCICNTLLHVSSIFLFVLKLCTTFYFLILMQRRQHDQTRRLLQPCQEAAATFPTVILNTPL